MRIIERTKYQITVPYNLPFDQQRKRSNCYYNSGINERNFPIIKRGKQEEIIVFVEICAFDVRVEYKDMGSLGYNLACIEHALAFAREHPDVQYLWPIIILGSIGTIANDLYCPSLSYGESGRIVDIFNLNNNIQTNYRVMKIC